MVNIDSVRRWSAAIRQVEVLEPWLTESYWDDRYWDDVAGVIVEHLGAHPSFADARSVLASALIGAFPDVPLESNNGLYREELDRRLDVIVGLVLDPSSS